VNGDREGSAPRGASATVDGRRRRFGRARDDGSGEASMVDRAEFSSYYGRPVLKPPVWTNDIAYYFFLGGLAAGSSLLAAGADRTGRTALRRGSRLGAAAAISAGSVYLIKDLGRPERFHHMLRVAKLTSPMSVGTWILTAYGPLAGLAAVAEVVPGRMRGRLVGRLLTAAGRPAGLGAAVLAPAVASYTSVLISDTAVPAWHEALDVLPFIFTGSAAASAGGLGMIVAPVAEAAPARRLALYGAIVEITASRKLEGRGTAAAEPYLAGETGRRLNRASTLTVGGVLGSLLFGRRSRLAAVASGVALLLGGLYERLGIFQAGIESAKKTTS
jgi:hypothetical protein